MFGLRHVRRLTRWVHRIPKPIVLAAILILAGAIRVGYTFSLPEDTFLQIDGGDYRDIARNLAHGDGFSISYYRWFEAVPDPPEPIHADLYRPPLVPLLGSLLFHLPGDWMVWARCSCVLLGVLLVGLLYLVGTKLFDRATGILAASVFALYPYAIYYSSHWSTETPFALAILLGVLFLSWFLTNRRLLWVFLAGAVTGLACLARPTGLALFGAFGLWLASGRRVPRRGAALLLFSLGCLVIVTPWAARNYSVTRIVNPLTFFGPYNVWLGMNERMCEMYRAGESSQFAQSMDALDRRDLRDRIQFLEQEQVFEIRETNRFWLGEAWRFAQENPGKASRILLGRFLHFWRVHPNRATVSRTIFWLSVLSVGPLMILALLALIRTRESRNPLVLIPVLAGLLAGLPFVFHLRFRFPVFDPYLILLAAWGVRHLWISSQQEKKGEARIPT